jgi:hypothetical protein
MMDALKQPIAPGTDPDAYLDQLEARTGRQLNATERAQGKEWIARVSDMLTTASDDASYIPAARARRMPVAFLLGPLLQRYALRHGWVVGMPLFARLKWRLVGIVEGIAGVTVAVIASKLLGTAFVAVGAGVAAGGASTYLIAPAMPSRSVEGSVMRAQLAAYRRTLAASLANATSVTDVAASSRLTWLETPDQTIVWAVALGLRKELEAFFERLPHEAGELVTLGADPPSGVVAAPARDPAAVLAGIDAIGATARE